MTDIVHLFCLPIAEAISQVLRSQGELLQEIRIRAGKPLSVSIAGQNRFVSPQGALLEDPAKALRVDWDMILKCLEFMSGSSLYAYENEMQSGYITVEGGHRIGMVGKAILQDGHIKGVSPIAGLNVRVAHQVRGCAEKLLSQVTDNERMLHTLIISPPGGGKTTMLRDLIRLASDRMGLTVAVADERSEIGGSYRGIPQCDLGLRTDVLDGCPKAEGMMMLLRAMNPQVIAVDELGGMAEIEVVRSILNAGVKLLCTAHGANLEEVRKRPGLGELLQEQAFESVVLLSGKKGPGTLEGIYRKTGDGHYGMV